MAATAKRKKMTILQVRNSVGWTPEVLLELLKVGRPILRVDGEEMMANGRFQIAAVTVESVEVAQEVYATIQRALQQTQ